MGKLLMDLRLENLDFLGIAAGPYIRRSCQAGLLYETALGIREHMRARVSRSHKK
ncbi:MAG: hypothetical protein ACYSR0_10295 [Planctomycetota bacterium]|jgi:hypothetical protein